MLRLIENHQLLPLHSFVVPCGFPSPADDHLEDNIDLVAHLVSRPSATFVMQVSGDSMEGAGIFTGDYVVIDKSVETKPGHIVVAVLNGEMTLKKFEKRAGQYLLLPPILKNISLFSWMRIILPKSGASWSVL